MINYASLTNTRPIINYDTMALTIQGYELKFALDLENPDLKEVIEDCKKNNLDYKAIDGENRQKHIWIKGWTA